jgi:arsenate reductase
VSRPLKRVLFVCIGNSCRSQMAEGFARAYGSDVMVPASAGLAPATRVASDTLDAMNEKGINLKDHFPKAMRHLGRVEFDIVVNISGQKLPQSGNAKVVEWKIDDPIGLKYEEHCDVRDEIERKVMQLILELRREQSAPEPLRGFGTGRLPI